MSFIPSALAAHNRPETFILNFLRDCPSRATSSEDQPRLKAGEMQRFAVPDIFIIRIRDRVFYVVLRKLNVRNFKGPLGQRCPFGSISQRELANVFVIFLSDLLMTVKKYKEILAGRWGRESKYPLHNISRYMSM